MADPPPQPTPFPIRIVQDPPGSDDGNDGAGDGPPNGGKPRVDEFYKAWEKFLAVQPKQAKKTSRAAKVIVDEKAAIEKSSASGGLRVKENASTSWEQAAKECKAKVEAIVKECQRLNQKYRDAVFDIEANDYCLRSLSGQYPSAVEKIDAPPWIKRVEDIFDKPQFFIDGASAMDVHQGSSGDCWFLAALMAVSAKKELIDRLCVARDEKAGVYGFVFYRDGEWMHEVIDDKLFLRVGDDDDLTVVRDWDKDGKEGMGIRYEQKDLKKKLQRGGEALYFSHCKSDETWLPLIEKAYAKAHGDYSAIEGGFASEAIEDLTGGVGVVINPEEIMDKDRFWDEQLSQVNAKYLFGGGSSRKQQEGIVSSHAYAVLQAYEDKEKGIRMLKMRNPWGRTEWQGDWSDGSKLWTPKMMIKLDHTFGDDGIFWIGYKDFLQHFPSINRVRLFDSGWSVAQQWTSVNVPWTVDYLDTKFKFTIEKAGDVVVVLQQPDDRYWYALRGRFLFGLHFRVYREGALEDGERWLVRSMHNSGNETIFTRSVSAELTDLEAGTYEVIFKITATRSQGAATAQEAVFKYAHERKEKLLNVGRRYDYAQTKGDLKGLEERNREARRKDLRWREHEGYRAVRRHNLKVNARGRRVKARLEKYNRERREAWELRCKERESRRPARKGNDNEGDGDDGEGEPTPPETETGGKEDDETKAEDSGDEADDDDEGEEESDEQSDDEDEQAPPSKSLDKLSLDTAKGAKDDNDTTISPVSPNTSKAEEDAESVTDDSPPPTDLEDDADFDWDPAIDSPIDSEEDPCPDFSATGRMTGNEIFADDPWNAMCVVGMRVYAKGQAAARVWVEVDDEGEEEVEGIERKETVEEREAREARDDMKMKEERRKKAKAAGKK